MTSSGKVHYLSDRTFGRFTPTSGSREALELSSALASGRVGVPQLILLHGPPGVGKTHLLQSILHVVRVRQPSASAVHKSAAELVQGLVAALRGEPTADPRPACAQAAVVVVDDLHVLAGMPAAQREVAALLATALRSGARVACAAGSPPGEIPVLADGLRGLPAARLIELRPPSDRDMREILAAIATSEGMSLDARTLASLAARSRGDVRRAAGALARRRFSSYLTAVPQPPGQP